MLIKDASAKALKTLFRRKPVVDLGALFEALDTHSRMSVFRRLREFGYFSSYTHRGGYYTLPGIPDFDENGLWIFRGIGFSHAGTLKATLVERIRVATAGHTHPELEALLHIRVHNTLLALVKDQRIVRERMEKLYVYVSAEEKRAAEQVKRRWEWLEEGKRSAQIPVSTVVEILLEVVRTTETLESPRVISDRLRARGILVEEDQVGLVFARYGLEPEKKTPRSHSKQSRR